MSGYMPGSSHKSAVERDLSSARISIFMEMNDKRMSRLDIVKALVYAEDKYPNLFEDYVENAYSQGMDNNKSVWDKHYYHLQEVYTSSNFSVDRIKHMLDVRDKVF